MGGKTGATVSSKKVAKAAKAAKKAAAAAPRDVLGVMDKMIGELTSARGRLHATKMVIHRVELLDEANQPAVAALMRAQSLDPDEAAAFLAKPRAQKLVLWSRYVPEDAPVVLTKDRVAPDLVIGPGVNLTREEFVAWHTAANSCQFDTYAHKLVLDAMLARGDALVLPRDPAAPVPRPTALVLKEVQRVNMYPQLPINGFYLVDPEAQPEYARRPHDGAFPVYHQGCTTGDDRELMHTLLWLTFKPVGGGEPEVYLLDPTVRQVYPRDPMWVSSLFMRRTRVRVEYGKRCEVVAEEGRFSIKNVAAHARVNCELDENLLRAFHDAVMTATVDPHSF